MSDWEEHVRIIVDVITDTLEKQMKPLEKVLTQTDESVKEIRKSMSGLAKDVRNLNINMLALGFFGRMVEQTMTGLLRPAMEVVGLFDIWSTTLQVFFLPIMMTLLPILLQIMQWFMDLPQPVQLVIGAIVALGAALGSLVSTFAFWTIGLEKFLAMMPALKAAFGSITSFIGGALVAYIAIEILTDTLNGKVADFKESLKSAFIAAFGALLLGFGVEGALLVFGAVIVFKYVLPRLPSWITKLAEGADNFFNSPVGSSGDTWGSLWNNMNFGMTPEFDHRNETTPSLPQSIATDYFTGVPGQGQSVVINQNNNITVSDKNEMQRLIDESNKKVVDDIKRQVKVTA